MSIEDEAYKSEIKPNTAVLSNIKNSANDSNKKSLSNNLLNHKIQNYSYKNNNHENQNRSKSKKNSQFQNFKDLSSLKKLNPDYLDSPNFDERIKNTFQFRNSKGFNKSPYKNRENSISNNNNNISNNNILLNKIANEFQRKSYSNFSCIENAKNFDNSICKNTSEAKNLKSIADAQNLERNVINKITNTNRNKSEFIRDTYSINYNLRNRCHNKSSNKLSISVSNNKTEILETIGNKTFFDNKINYKTNKNKKFKNSCCVNNSYANKPENNENAFLEIKNDIIEKVNNNFNNEGIFNGKYYNTETSGNKINQFFGNKGKKHSVMQGKNAISGNNKTIDYWLKRKSEDIPFSANINATIHNKNLQIPLNQSSKNLMWNQSLNNKQTDCYMASEKNEAKNDVNINIKIKGINKGNFFINNYIRFFNLIFFSMFFIIYLKI